MQVTYEVKWNDKTKRGLNNIPNDILYAIAKQTLDYSVPMIPQSKKVGHAGTLRRASISGGVRGGNGDYYIGSYVNYASRVWRMNDSTTNWTTPGTHSQWFARTLKQYGKIIADNAINQSWKKEF